MLAYHPLNQYGCKDCHLPVTPGVPEQDNDVCPAVAGHVAGSAHVQASCGACHENIHDLHGAHKAFQGEYVFESRGCIACHFRPPKPAEKKFAPPLNGLQGKLKQPSWLPAWLLSPKTIRPGTMMPDFRMTLETARDISAFLLSLNDPHAYAPLDLSAASPEKGEYLFIYRGCLACHQNSHDPSFPPDRIPGLNDAGVKLRPEWVLLELEDPREYNPDARIPLLDVPKDETLDIIAYLNSHVDGDFQSQIDWATGEKGDPIQGKRRVQGYGCYGCHDIQGFKDTLPPGGPPQGLRPDTTLNTPGAGPWVWLKAAIDPANDALDPDTPLKMPRFNLSEKEIDALVVYLMTPPPRKTGRMVRQTERQAISKKGDRILADYGCAKCHMLQEGVQPHAASVLDRRLYIPPRLVGEGEKVQSPFLKEYVLKPFPMRIWMSMRMPLFYLSHTEADFLVRHFRGLSGQEMLGELDYDLPFDIQEIDPEEKEMGSYRFQRDRCMQCHPMDMDQALPQGVALDDLAIHLMLTKDRLQYEWVRSFLRDPDTFAGPDTRMPFIYYTPDGLPKVTDADQWLDRVARFLYIMETPPDDFPADAGREDIPDVTGEWIHY